MANEITKTVSIQTTKNGGANSVAPNGSASRSITQTGNYSSKFSGTVTQAAVFTFPIPSAVSYPCHLEIENLDPTNYFDISNAGGGGFASGKFSRVPPGDRVIIVALAAVYGQANVADCKYAATAIEV